jgi:hypothetical protein
VGAEDEGDAGHDLTFLGPMKTMMADSTCCYIFLDKGPDKEGQPLVPHCKYSSSQGALKSSVTILAIKR